MPYKHALNPPIVTIFGAGVAGLTAAHELVERGFIVQVVEAEEDVYSPGRPIVGGMAANQRARIRANVEDLHRDLLMTAWSSGDAERPAADVKVARWLIKLFVQNRSRWLATEEPVRLHHSLFSEPEQHPDFVSSLLESLRAARAKYRERWIWDLTLRGVMLNAIRLTGSPPETTDLEHAKSVFERLVRDDSTPELATNLLESLSWDGDARDPELPSQAELEKHMTGLVVPALEREFLCFRLIPHARRGFEKGPGRARFLLSAWSNALKSAFSASCLSKAAEAEHLPVEATATPVEIPAEYSGWVELDVIEQRLPGEHGYRFFPSFYRHLDDTMKRTPLFDGSGRSVYDNLKPTVFQGVGFSDADRDEVRRIGGTLPDHDDPTPCTKPKRKPAPAKVVELHRDRPRSLEGFRDRTDRFVQRLGGTRRDAILLLAKLVRFLTSSSERRRAEYENQSWEAFLEIEKFSAPMQRQIKSAAQALLAFSSGEVDARTYGNVALQMLLDQFEDGTRVDRTLNGPTSDVWLEPWREYLERHGVRFFQRRLLGVREADGELVPVFDAPASADPIRSQDGFDLLTHEQANEGLRPDFYLLALSLGRTLELLEPLPVEEQRGRDFARVKRFGEDALAMGALKTMTGVQFFFDAKTSIGRGHMYFPFSAWGLSSISQSEFWSSRGGFSDGYFGVLSIDVCSTGDPSGKEPKTFWSALKQGTSPEIEKLNDPVAREFSVAHEIWSQIYCRISERDEIAEPRCFHLDRTVSAAGNTSEYLASLAKLDRHRPGRSDSESSVGDDEIDYSMNYDRWVLCGAFMATHTRMTTMEAANEAARHATRAVLRQLKRVDGPGDETEAARGQPPVIENLRNKTYNGASRRRVYDEPDIWNPEQQELEDLDIFRRVDRRLVQLELDHFMDIIDFDRKLLHALDAVELYGGQHPLPDLLGGAIASMDAVLTKELGRGYDQQIGARWNEAQASFEKLGQELPSPMFDDMKGLLRRLHKLFETFKT